MKQRVAILGASEKPDRYAFKAFSLLKKFGHEPLPISPRLSSLQGVKAFGSIAEVPAPIDTLTMYVGPAVSEKLEAEIVKAAPRRVIFNPGSENERLAQALRAAGIQVEEACTLVLLSSNQF